MIMTDAIVFIVDDDASVRESLSILLRTSGFHTEPYPSGQAFLDNYDDSKNGCLLLDNKMPEMSGLELRQLLTEKRISIPTIIITAYGDIPTAVKAMQLGAIDFIEKPYSEDLIINKVKSALALGINSEEHDKRVTQFHGLHRTLTTREKQVFLELIKGHQNKIIARQLDISPRTVEIHRANILGKLQVPNLAQLIRMAILAGIS